MFPSTEQRLELDSLPHLLGQALMRSSSTPQGTPHPQHRGQVQDARGSWHGRQLGAPWQLVGPLSACMNLCVFCVCGNVPTPQLICMESGPLAQGLVLAASPGSIACCWQGHDGVGLGLCILVLPQLAWAWLATPQEGPCCSASLGLEHCAVCALQDTASMQTLDGFGSSLGDVNNLSISSRPTSISLEMAHESGLGSGLAVSMTANGGSACVQQQQQQQQQQQVNHLLLQHSKLQNGGQFALDQGAFSWPAMNFGSSLIQPKALPASPIPGGCPLLQQAMLGDRNQTPLDNSLDLLGDCDTKQGLAELPFLF